MKFRKLGNTNENLSAIGLGCMGMNHAYGVPNENESIKVLHKALDLGINFWDTADMYAKGKNEELVSKVLSSNRDKVFIATKFGFRYKDEKAEFKGMDSVYLDCRPEYIITAVEASLKRLKIETIDLYYAHRIDPKVPVEDMIGAMAELVKQGKVKYLGLSEASVDSIKRANKVHPISALQSEYSLLTRDIENEIIPVCRELNISIIPFSPLARGLITNTVKREEIPENDFRKNIPRFDDEHWQNNQKLVEEFEAFAKNKNCTPAQLALAWVLSQGEDIIPIPGTKKLKYLEENAKSVDVNLSNEDKKQIESLLIKYPNIGNRYNATTQKLVDNKK